ncbi:MAG: hypothetical protein ACREND_14165, partial [Gemmatimonadaceae bacterium]
CVSVFRAIDDGVDAGREGILRLARRAGRLSAGAARDKSTGEGDAEAAYEERRERGAGGAQ